MFCKTYDLSYFIIFRPLKITIENDIVVVLRNKATKIVVSLKEANELLGRSIVGKFLRTFSIALQKFLENFLN